MYRYYHNTVFKYLSTISFKIKWANLLSTFLKFLMSLFGGCFVALGFPFWALPTRGVTLVRWEIFPKNYALQRIVCVETEYLKAFSTNLWIGGSSRRWDCSRGPDVRSHTSRCWLIFRLWKMIWGLTTPFWFQFWLCETSSRIFSIMYRQQIPSYKHNKQISGCLKTNLREQAYLLPCPDWWSFYPEVSLLAHIDRLRTEHGSKRYILRFHDTCIWMFASVITLSD